ncbi:MAG TPA: hypothetical protein VD962_11750 [Rubricoccaceae bacterium]|nr:hypothetical protein [Rubricoccaceae bacterium]
MTKKDRLTKEEWQALAVSTWFHALLIALCGLLVHVPDAQPLDLVARRDSLILLTYEPLPVLGPEGGSPTVEPRAPRTNEVPAPRPRPAPARVRPARPPTPTPVRLPEATPTRRPTPENPSPPPAPHDPDARASTPSPPSPRQDPNAPPAPPSPPVEGTNDNGGVSATGAPGRGDGNQDGGGRGGTGGGSGIGFAGLGSRSATCSLPAYPGVNGTVSYFVTFAPNGRYVSSRPRQRGNSRLEAAVQRIIRTCRAAALPEAASQVNQEGVVTFRFTSR